MLGQSTPEILHTYSAERHAVAKELIDFDRDFAAMFSATPKTAPDDEDGVDPAVFQQYFQQQGRFTAGVATQYQPSLLTSAEPDQDRARGFTVGTRFHSAPVVRLADGKPLQLGHVIEADGRWRLFAFADRAHPSDVRSGLTALCRHLLEDERSPLVRYTPAADDIDAVFDLRAIVQQPHHDLNIGDVHPLLRPRKGRYGLIDYEKVFLPRPRDRARRPRPTQHRPGTPVPSSSSGPTNTSPPSYPSTDTKRSPASSSRSC